MKDYVKPMVINTEEVAESVYMASGGSDCYTVRYEIHQKPELGRGDYRIKFEGSHAASDNHHSGEQVLTINFNQPVTYKESNGTLDGGNGTSTLNIKFKYHNNGGDYIGMGDVVVEADPGLAVTGASLSCNYACSDNGHSW